MKRDDLIVYDADLTNCPYGVVGVYTKDEADSVMDSMERRIARLTRCVESWKKANEVLQQTNSRLRKAISLNSLKEIEYMYAENANLKKMVKELEEENKHLEDYIDAYQKSEALNIEKLDKKDERINELEATISKMETTAPKWISVKDRLPKEGKEVIVFYTCWKHEYQQVAMFESGEFIDLGGCALSPTHWQPLPPPPTTEEK